MKNIRPGRDIIHTFLTTLLPSSARFALNLRSGSVGAYVCSDGRRRRKERSRDPFRDDTEEKQRRREKRREEEEAEKEGDGVSCLFLILDDTIYTFD